MAHTRLPEPITTSINTAKMCPTEFSTTLSDVLQSDPVKRLLNRPNIVVKTIPLKIDPNITLNHSALKKTISDKDSNPSKQIRSELSVILFQTNQDNNNRGEENLLPSKNQGKSEITLMPVQMEGKPCGHFSSCEHIVCDVMVQHYVDHEGSSPMLAVNIEENEINAAVSKHCTNNKCDALSIDHDRCRRAVIRLNRCDSSTVCDICDITLRTPRSRVYHKDCTRKNEYRHNQMSSAQILKERMREREAQMVEASKVKRHDYMDPATSCNHALEMLKNNKELIVTPKSVPLQHQPLVTVTSVPRVQSPQQCNRANNVFGKILPSIPLVLPQQIFDQVQCSNENSITSPTKGTLPDTLNPSPIRTTSAVPFAQNQYVTFTTQSNIYPLSISDFIVSRSQAMSTPKSLTAVRVVPITNLMTQPSSLHQTQGIPKFCIMSDNTLSTFSINPIEHHVTWNDSADSLQHGEKELMAEQLGKLKKNVFRCRYCPKKFRQLHSFKAHMALHGDIKQFFCRMCRKSFDTKVDQRKHSCIDFGAPRW